MGMLCILIVSEFINGFCYFQVLPQALSSNSFVWYDVQIKDGFSEGKDLIVSVMSSMGEEQICALKDIGPK